MKVGMYYNNSDVRVEEIPKPTVDNKDILIKVNVCGICGSDILEWYRIKKAPLVLGHELSGEVIQVGNDITKFKPGDRVFSTHHVPCNECHYCLTDHETACVTFQTKNNFNPGGFSEYLKVSGRSVDTGTLRLPDEVTYEEASFIEPLGTVVRGLRRLELKPGDSMLVLGAGIAGILMIKLGKALGAGRIIATDINDIRLDSAKKFGAEHVFNASDDIPKVIKEVNNDKLADKVVICTGALSAVKQALKSVDKGGTVMFFAVPTPDETVDIDFNPYWRDDISFITSYGAAPQDNQKALELIRAGNINVKDMITHRLSLNEIAKGFELAGKGEGLKILIKPNMS